MSLVLPYAQLPTNRPVIPLGGRATRPRALARATLVVGAKTYLSRCLLDTGADDTVFHESIAQALGLDLSSAPVGEATGVASIPTTIRYARVTLRLTDGREWCEWVGWVGFTAQKLRQPLLGFAGCLQYFHAEFRGDREEVELKTNTLFDGSSGVFAPH